MSIFELLFGFQGRISRSQWWLGQFVLAALIAIFISIHTGMATNSVATAGLIKSGTPAQSFKFFGSMLVATSLLSSALVWVAFALAIKRLHDRSQSGWKALVFGVPVVLFVAVPHAATQAFALAAVAWYILELGFLAGDTRHNKHGAAITPDHDGDESSIDPVDLSLSENIARSALKASGARRMPVAGSNGAASPASAKMMPGGAQAGFGRRPH